jgi:hypothetical protein
MGCGGPPHPSPDCLTGSPMRISLSTKSSDHRRIERSSLKRRCLSLTLAGALLCLVPASVLSESRTANPSTQARGEILMLTSELMVVKSAEGTSILIPLSKDTPLDPSLKVGDLVEVVAAGSHVTSVKRLTFEPLQ